MSRADETVDRLLKAGIRCLADLAPDYNWQARTIDDGFTVVDVHLERGFLVLEIGTSGSPATTYSAGFTPQDAQALAVKLAKAAQRVLALCPRTSRDAEGTP